jgi:hypothetical protein
MKKIINGVRYNTETAQKLAENYNNLGYNDFYYLNEEIYRTTNGKYFLFGEGGAATKYGISEGNFKHASETIIPLSEKEVFDLLEKWNEVEMIEELFPDRIQDA